MIRAATIFKRKLRQKILNSCCQRQRCASLTLFQNERRIKNEICNMNKKKSECKTNIKNECRENNNFNT